MSSTRNLEKIQRKAQRNEQHKKSKGSVSNWRLMSCYLASALIVILCLYEVFVKGDDIIGGSISYIFLAAIALGFSVMITRRNAQAQTQAKSKKNKRK